MELICWSRRMGSFSRQRRSVVRILAGVCDGNAQTMTVPQSGGAKFYKLNGLGPNRVTKVARSGSNIVLTYKLYFQPGF